MLNAESLEIIRRNFAHVSVRKIEFVDDPEFGRLVKVYVTDGDLSAALGENGTTARRAAMQSGIDVEVIVIGT